MSTSFNPKCGRCKYGLNNGSLETSCDYSRIEDKTKLKQIYERLGVKELTPEAQRMALPENCPFFQWDGVTHAKGKKHGNVEFDWDKAAKLHDQKMSAGQIAKEIGASIKTVYDWYRRSGRKPNPYRQKKLDRVKLLELYRQGKTDREIAAAIGCCLDSVRVWRKECALDANRGKKEESRGKGDTDCHSPSGASQ